jgi:hypothetical protein
MSKINAEQEAALHGYIEEAFKLAAQIRIASGGVMTLAAVRNIHVPQHIKTKAGFVGGTEWIGAHDLAFQLAHNDDEPAGDDG